MALWDLPDRRIDGGHESARGAQPPELHAPRQEVSGISRTSLMILFKSSAYAELLDMFWLLVVQAPACLEYWQQSIHRSSEKKNCPNTCPGLLIYLQLISHLYIFTQLRIIS